MTGSRHPLVRALERLGDDERVAYLRAERLRRVLGKTAVVDRLLEHLGAAPSARRLGADEKLEALFDHAQEMTDHPRWSGYTWGEVLVVALDDAGHDCFDRVQPEKLLSAPVERFLRSVGCSVLAEEPIGNRRADVLGYRHIGKRERLEFIGVELKTDVDEWKRGPEQLATYALYCHRVYLACAPGFALDVLRKHAAGRGSRGWSAEVLQEVLYRSGFGLLLVEGRSVYEVHEPQPTEPDERNVEHLANQVARRVSRA